MIAVELDSELAEGLRARYGAESALQVMEADVLQTDLRQWGPAVVAGNLPYYITSPILERVLDSAFERAVFLVQKEVANRIAARPGSPDYGFLSVRTACRATARVLFPVKPGAFRPPPQVESAVVLLEPRPGPFADCAPFLEFVGRCFRQKRKTLRNNLAAFYGKEAIEEQAEAGMRAEQLTLEQFADLYSRLSAWQRNCTA